MVGPLPPSAEVTFCAADPPRRSTVACWVEVAHAAPDLFVTAPDPPPLPGTSGLVTLLRPPPQGGTPRPVDRVVNRVPLIDLVPQLMEVPPTATATQRALAETVRAGLALVGAGRVLPGVTPAGWDAWAVAPLDSDDLAVLERLASTLPAGLHATPLAGHLDGRRMAGAEATVQAIWDSLADSLPRGEASEGLTGSHLYASPSPTRVVHLRTWAASAVAKRCRGSALELCMCPPPKDEPTAPWRLNLRLRSRAHPTVAIDAAELGASDHRHRLGPTPWDDLRSELARVGRHWSVPPTLMQADHPTSAVLDDAELDALIDATDELKRAGVRLFWPDDGDGGTVEVRAEVRAPADGGFGLEQLCDTRWRAHVGGRQLNADELEQLLAARRPLIRTADGWVRVPEDVVERLRQRGPRVSVGEAMAAMLGEPGHPTAPDVGDDQTEPDEAPSAVSIDGLAVSVAPTLVERARRLATLATTAPPVERHIAGLAEDVVLRHYQHRGVAWMAGLAELGVGGVLADDMGLGKTLQTIATHCLLHGPEAPQVPGRDDDVGPIGPTLVVAPTSLLGTWERECRRFAPLVPVRRYHGTKRDLGNLALNEVVVTTYGVLRRDHGQLGECAWGMVVADEAQAVKNPTSRAARSLRRVHGRFRLALTGTPMENHLGELWALMDWVVPGALGTSEDFRARFADPIERHASRPAQEGLRRRIAPLMLRRTKADPSIAPELPPKIERDVVVGLTAEQGALYDAAVGDALDRIASAEGIARRGLVLALLTSLKQICNHPAHHLGDGGPLPGRSAKLQAFDDLLDAASAARDDGRAEPTLVFTQYVTMANLLAQHLSGRGISHAVLDGSLSPTQRQRLTDDFQAGRLDVLVCSLRAAGTGLTLTRATQVIHYDRWWNPAVEDQATDRAHRIGQQSTVSVHRLVTEGTVEERVAEVLDSKRQLAGAVIGSGLEGWIGGLDDSSLADLVRRETPAGRRRQDAA
ncbi:MAG: SNF2-related protein [Microthrixaceae bacterium]